MKKALLLAGASLLVTACAHDPNWHKDCNRNFSEKSSIKAECEASMGHSHGTDSANGVGLRNDLSASRTAEGNLGAQSDN